MRTGRGQLKRVGDGMAVYVREDKAIHVLNPTAYILYEALDEPVTFADLLAALAQATGRARIDLEIDLKEALQGFVALRLVERR